ncbi:MAG: translation initiation factor IF-2 [Bacteroidales bacterium]|nr:translation initiation factor IF-2 [Bacteroidales bacterium]
MNKITKGKRLLQIARELNVGIEHLVDHLQENNIEVDARPNAKVSGDGYELLLEKFSSDKKVKEESEKLIRLKREREEETFTADDEGIIEEEEGHDTKAEEDIKDEAEVKKEEIEKDVKETHEPIEEKKEEIESVTAEDKKEKVEDDDLKEKIAVDEVKEIPDEEIKEKTEDGKLKLKGKIDLSSINQKTRPDKKTTKERREERKKRKEAVVKAQEKVIIKKEKTEEEVKRLEQEKFEEQKRLEQKRLKEEEERNFIKTKVEKLTGPKVIGKITIEEKKEKEKKEKTDKKKVSSGSIEKRRRKRRKRIRKPLVTDTKTKDNKDTKRKTYKKKKEVSEEDVQKQVRDTLAKLTNKTKKTSVKHRKKKREEKHQQIQEEIQQQEKEKSVLKVTEFISANELAKLMDVGVNEIIATSFELGKMVTINSRLDAEIIGIIGEEYGFEIEFISATEDEILDDFVDKEEDLKSRYPIVTVMGHVDHGKTSLLDFIRDANVIAGEAGGITQHIGAYSVELEEGKRVTFLDTPGHEAFTAMRARGAKVTDIAIIIVAADDNIMPQTEEAISHAKAADVPIVFAINKIDKTGADPERIKQELAEKNMLVEAWGGKYQSADISAKNGTNVDGLLEEVILAAELLELKANPDRPAKGTVIEAELDKGRGYLSTILVQTGTLKIGDILLAGAYSGKIKAMYDERKNRVEEAGPSIPVQILGLDGAPQAGETFYVMKSEKEAREIADRNKRIQREQTLRTHKHITLDEIGRRLQLGNFQEINIIIKGDVIGSVEAVADSLIKLGTDEVQVKVIHKGVGQISEADVMLAAASDAIVVGFQVRPALAAKKLAEKEEIDIRLYSIIYQAIEEMKSAMEGMLSPEVKEEITATVEVREVFKVSKSGKVAGCFVLDGKINREDKIRLIREGIVKYQGELGSLRRFKDDVKEVITGMECGLNIENFNDIKVGDIIESYRETETARKL